MIFHLFKKKRSVEQIKLEDLNSWIKKVSERKNLSLKLGIMKRELLSKQSKLHELLVNLKNAKFADEKIIPERAKHIFEGNRASYIQKVESFLDKVYFPEDVFLIKDFLEETSESLDMLAKDTQKNYFICKEFVGKEVDAVASKLKELDNVISSGVALIDNTPLGKFKEIQNLINDYHQGVDSLAKQKKVLEDVLERKASEVDRCSKVEEKIIDLKKSKQYEDYSSLISKKIKLEADLKNVEDEVVSIFSPLSSVLKKYSKKKRNKLSGVYADKPVNGLLEDEQFKVLDLIKDAEKIKDTLDLKDSKVNKLLGATKISSTKLKSLRIDLLKLRDDVKDISFLLKNHAFVLNLKEQEGRISNINHNIKDIEKEEKNAEELLERISPNLTKQKLKTLIKSIDEYSELI